MSMSELIGGNKRGPSRRTIVRTGLGAAVSMPAILSVIPVNAQSRVIKIGHVSPRTGPLAAFGEALRTPFYVALGSLQQAFALIAFAPQLSEVREELRVDSRGVPLQVLRRCAHDHVLPREGFELLLARGVQKP